MGLSNELKNAGFLAISVALTLSGAACSKKTAATATGTITSAVKSNKNGTSGALSLIEGAGALPERLTGGSGTSGLTSLKYYISSIQICQSMTPNGTAFTNQSGCIELFHGGSDSHITSNGSTPDYASDMTYAKSLTTGYIDLLDSTSLATLNGAVTLPSGSTGDYKWGLINWGYPIKLTGTVTMSDGTSLYTHDGTYTNYSGGNGGLNTSATSFASGPAEEAIITLPNGGTWFAFQTPFHIDETQSYNIDLVFNPSGLLKAANPANTNNPPLTDGTQSMSIPFLNLSPVPHASTDTVSKETYIAQVDSGSSHFDVRLELYYQTSDATKTIYGVDAQTIARAGTASDSYYDFQKVSYVTSSGGTLTFEDYNQAALISGFTRQSTAGQTTTATIGCSASFNLAGCGTTVTFTRQ
jgi:hypothetical protein